MNSNNAPRELWLGEVISEFSYDFDGDRLDVVKHHPWARDGHVIKTGHADKSVVRFHCEAMRASFASMQECLVAWIAHKNLGLNQYPLIYGVCRALNVRSSESA